MVPVLQSTYNISLSQNGLLPFAQGVGAIIVLIISIAIADRFNKRTLMVIAYIVYNAALYIAAMLPPYWTIVVLFFFVGAGVRLYDALANANMSELGGEKKGLFLNVLHGFFGFGALFGPIIASRVLVMYDLSTSLLAIACICSVLLIIGLGFSKNWRKTFPAKEEGKSNEDVHSLAILLKSKTMWLLGLCSMVYAGFVISIGTWLPSYIATLGANTYLAAGVVSFLWVGIISGRFVYSILSLKFSMYKLIFVSTAIGGVAIICASVINTIPSYIAGYACSGFLAGAVVPLCIAIANKEFPNMSGRISSIIILFVSFGMMIVPPVIGIIAENVSFYSAIFILNLCPIIIAALSFLLNKCANK